MHWFHTSVAIRQARADASRDAHVVAALLRGARMTRTASGSRPDVHFYVDPDLAARFNVNLHLISANDKAIDGMSKKAASDEPDFKETTISFPSKRKSEPNYVCSVVFQKPDDEVYAVSAYMVETYLGQYAYKDNYYFRKGSKAAALRCYQRVLRAVEDLRTDVLEGGRNQNEVPYMLRRSLQGESGEINPKSNKMATYLDPANVAPASIGSENIVYIPKGRRLADDLEMSSPK